MGCDSEGGAVHAVSVISIHAPRVGCDGVGGAAPLVDSISIHAPRVGCDLVPFVRAVQLVQFQSTHPVWGATESHSPRSTANEFQSTHPVWGATQDGPRLSGKPCYFNPRTPCGVRPSPHLYQGFSSAISIHAPRVGCDPHFPAFPAHSLLFQSTHPVWGATWTGRSWPNMRRNISIHAPRVGCDPLSEGEYARLWKFQSTHPVWGATVKTSSISAEMLRFQSTHPVWGATQGGKGWRRAKAGFQSTHPVWGATASTLPFSSGTAISIHAPRVGCDFIIHNVGHSLNGFQSTHPVWGATRSQSPVNTPRIFQSTHPVWGATAKATRPPMIPPNFNPRTPCGVRPGRGGAPGPKPDFNPRTPCGVRLHTLPRPLPVARISIHAPRVGCDAEEEARYRELIFQSTHPVWGATRSRISGKIS